VVRWGTLNLSSRQARWVAGAALAIPILVLFLPFAPGSRNLYGRDFEVYFRPHAVFVRDSWRRDRELPRWNPYQYAGVPFLGNSMGNLHYPGNWLFLILSPEAAFGAFALLHLLVAAFGMYRLTRHFHLARPACLLAAIAYSLSFSIILRIHAGHLPFLITQSHAPLLLFLALKAVDRPSIPHAAALAAMIGLVLLGGTPQFVYHLALLSVALVVWRLIARGGPPRAIAAVVVSGFLGAAIAAVSLLPSFEVAEGSSRGGADAATFAKLAEPYHDIEPAHFLAFWIPMFPWTPGAEAWLAAEKGIYLGMLPLLLMLFRVSSGPLRGAALFFTVAGAVALLDGIGPPVHSCLSFLPWYGRFRIPERVFWIVVLCLAVLSAFGWEPASASVLTPRQRVRKLASLGALAALAAALVLLLHRAPEAFLIVGLAGASVAVLAYLPRGGTFAAIAVALTAVDLVGYGMLRLRSVPHEQYGAPPWYARTIGAERSEYRLLDLTTFEAKPVAHGFRLLRALGHPVPSKLSAYYASGWRTSDPRIDMLPEVGGPADPALLRRLNVRWVVAGPEPPVPGWKSIAQDQGRHLYEDPAPGPAAFLEGSEGSVTMTRPTANSIAVEARCSRPGRLVVSEAWAPGWQAQLEGRAIAVRTAAGELLEVDLPAGDSRVTFLYAPRAWKVGGWISGAALAVLGGLLLAEFWRRRSRVQAPPSAAAQVS
jgi:hypothetical protein